MSARVAAGLVHKGTLHQRAMYFTILRSDNGAKDMQMPPHIVVQIRDAMTATPGAADNMVKMFKAIRALHAWGMDQGHVTENPASGIGKINRVTGAAPWSVSEMRKFREKHPVGTEAPLGLTLFMFTACRIDDAVELGRGNEVQREGIVSRCWTPGKRRSAPVTVPIMPLERVRQKWTPVLSPDTRKNKRLESVWRFCHRQTDSIGARIGCAQNRRHPLPADETRQALCVGCGIWQQVPAVGG